MGYTDQRATSYMSYVDGLYGKLRGAFSWARNYRGGRPPSIRKVIYRHGGSRSPLNRARLTIFRSTITLHIKFCRRCLDTAEPATSCVSPYCYPWFEDRLSRCLTAISWRQGWAFIKPSSFPQLIHGVLWSLTSLRYMQEALKTRSYNPRSVLLIMKTNIPRSTFSAAKLDPYV